MKNLDEVIEQKFNNATEKVELANREVLGTEEFEDIDEILKDVDIVTKRRILRHYEQIQRINDQYIQQWYAQGFIDGIEYIKKENSCK